MAWTDLNNARKTGKKDNFLLVITTVVTLLMSISTMVSAQQTPGDPARALLKRILPAYADRFVFERIPADREQDVFELEGSNGKIVLRGNSPLSQCVALNWYLKYYANAYISLNGTQLRLSGGLPVPANKIRMSSWAACRYFFNYCTFGYSVPWWDWNQWERLIDWMALQGINLPLAITGQEAVWQALGKRFGMSDADIGDFLAGPPYLPFQWMGCLDSFGGKLPGTWIQKRVALQRKILARERELGMKPVLQGFTGHVPKAILEKFPGAKARKIAWVDGFETWMLDPMDPLFQKLGDAFIEEQEKLFGTDHYYATDPFIEMVPPDTSEHYIANLGQAIQQGMENKDPEAVWLLQSWPFHFQGDFWKPNRVKALLDAVPDEKMLVLDLFCEYEPLWKKSHGFYGKPWIYNFIYNFGNNTLLGGYGPLAKLNDLAEVRRDADGKNIKGVGMMMEGFSENPMLYDMMFELAWRSDIDLQRWMDKFATFRYGSADPLMLQAWRDLFKARYSTGFSRLNRTQLPLTGYPPEVLKTVYEDPTTTAMALVWKKFLSAPAAIASTETYRFDLVNIARQTLSGMAAKYVKDIRHAWEEKDIQAYQHAAAKYLELVGDLDRLLATRKEFSSGSWFNDAERWGDNDSERSRMEWNARRIISRWGTGTRLRDYAWKEWSGMLNGFYARRWTILFEYQEKALENKTAFDPKACDAAIREFEDNWSNAHEAYSSEPEGDSKSIAVELYRKYIGGSDNAYKKQIPFYLPLAGQPLTDDR